MSEIATFPVFSDVTFNFAVSPAFPAVSVIVVPAVETVLAKGTALFPPSVESVPINSTVKDS